ncbi:MAG: recombinase RecA [Myxococcales bacterium]|nr:recombinase RecA [Myxococcales bacterium]
MKDSKLKSLSQAITNLEKQFGKGSVMRLGDRNSVSEIEPISTGSIGLDRALGVGGLPKGRIVEIYGPEASGKTTLTLHSIAECQAQGGTAAFIDAEHALDIRYAKHVGVQVEDLIVAQPDHGEQALEITEQLARSGAVDIIVIDSVAALVPKAEIEGEMGDAHMALQARLMSQALRKLTGLVSKTGVCIVFINQVRMKIGVSFGSPEVTTGGNALKFYASMRLDVRRIQTLKQGDQAFGSRTRVKVVKNKLASPFQQAEFDLLYGEGISKAGELLDWGLANDKIEKNGAWYAAFGQKLGQGRESARTYLKENQAVADKISELMTPNLSDGESSKVALAA